MYADTSVEREPASAEDKMNGHFATRSLNEDGSWKDYRSEKYLFRYFSYSRADA
jgi:hypothetical protein